MANPGADNLDEALIAANPMDDSPRENLTTENGLIFGACVSTAHIQLLTWVFFYKCLLFMLYMCTSQFIVYDLILNLPGGAPMVNELGKARMASDLDVFPPI